MLEKLVLKKALKPVALAAGGTLGAAVMMTQSAAYAGLIYPQTLIVEKVVQVDECDYNVTMRTSTGIAYTYTSEDGDTEPGDVISVIMSSNGTPDSVLDDDIIWMRYSGFRQMAAPDSE